MGVNGLTKFVQREDFTTTENYSNCSILVDASGMMYSILNNGISEETHTLDCGGNYKEFESKVIKCFQKLEQCQITPIVVLDGATPLVKHDSKLERLERSLENYRSMKFCTTFWHYLAIDVFVATLKRLKITVIQVPYEADDVLAFLSYRFDLPVLTNDSDFYFFRHPVLSIVDLIETEVVTEDGDPHLVLRTFNPKNLQERYNIENELYFRIAPILIGNDVMPSLQDHFPSWRGFGRNHQAAKDRNYNIKSILRWVA